MHQFPSDLEAIVRWRDNEVMLRPSQTRTVGRSPECDISIGLDPHSDPMVAEVAAELHLARGRVSVTNTDTLLAMEVVVPGRPPVTIEPQDGLLPAASSFSVTLTGRYRHQLTVQLRGAGTRQPRLPRTEDPRTAPLRELSRRQHILMEHAVAPQRSGGTEPLNHAELAEIMFLSPQSVRLDIAKIHSSLLDAGIPLRNHAYQRDEVVDAWLRHRIHAALRQHGGF